MNAQIPAIDDAIAFAVGSLMIAAMRDSDTHRADQYRKAARELIAAYNVDQNQAAPVALKESRSIRKESTSNLLSEAPRP